MCVHRLHSNGVATMPTLAMANTACFMIYLLLNDNNLTHKGRPGA
jgi:hypothetical protein